MRKPPTALIAALGLGLLLAGRGAPEALEEPAEPPAPTEPATGTCAAAGPQAPRDIDQGAGTNPVTFARAPSAAGMQLCDIHFHRFAEHKASGYPTQAGEGEHAGWVCAGREPQAAHGGDSEHGDGGCGNVSLGDTVEVHWVFTTCDVEPGPGLGSCFSSLCANPQLRVEAQVFYLTDGEEEELEFGGFADGATLPAAEGAIEYLGSTTGPKYNNRECSEFQVTWNVRPSCRPLSLASLDAWCDDNVFGEDHAHGVRELVTPLELLSQIR